MPNQWTGERRRIERERMATLRLEQLRLETIELAKARQPIGGGCRYCHSPRPMDGPFCGPECRTRYENLVGCW
jgi:hypothetical protein